MGGRRYGRIIALAALYQIEVADIPIEKVLKLEWIDKNVDKEIVEFATDLIKGTVENLSHIDALIKKYSEHWSFDRISPVDKSILRFSIYSLFHRKDIPPNVVIDEAIELSKIYSSEKSYQFINGILDGIKNNEIKK